MIQSQKLKARDYITIGLYTLLIYLVNAIVGMALSPAMFVAMPFLSGVCLFFSSIVYLLMAVKVGKKGAMLLMAAVTGLIYTLMGIVLMLPYFILAGIVGELVLWKGDGSQYRKIKRQSFAYAAYGSLFGVGNFMAIYVMGTGLFEKFNYSSELIKRMIYFAYSPLWMAAGLLFSFVVTLLGCYISSRMLKKHFVKAGYLANY
ncbi:MptD family putative ECF transporter S component [Sporolactobacillus shoreicorticis]|uniref:MptD family putative ECF transporter S component n=1 Tax=Sporolactobacillus shoreicorticis TaxID=1923877 RepID=A0ABW5S325_9BACL|nr:MptD family putative ECF transporter S component [Sporolactobacillus shoreicorticis]MCO7127055.1 MptD family putative ECF transporter S component [Sporolactobacillus shoreicorticis]